MRTVSFNRAHSGSDAMKYTTIIEAWHGTRALGVLLHRIMLQRPITSHLLRFPASVDGDEAEAGKYGHSRIAHFAWDVAGLWGHCSRIRNLKDRSSDFDDGA